LRAAYPLAVRASLEHHIARLEYPRERIEACRTERLRALAAARARALAVLSRADGWSSTPHPRPSVVDCTVDRIEPGGAGATAGYGFRCRMTSRLKPTAVANALADRLTRAGQQAPQCCRSRDRAGASSSARISDR
jgi:hypothetical protein